DRMRLQLRLHSRPIVLAARRTSATRWHPNCERVMSMPHGGFFSVDSLRGVWILVVDSNPRGRETLREILTYCGALVTPIASVNDALGVMRQVKPDMLVVALADDDDFGFI